MRATIDKYLEIYNQIQGGSAEYTQGKIPGGYFIGTDILMLPSDRGDVRYPYGADGFNYWTYGSGYIHCNEGLFSPFLRVSEGGEPKIAFFAGVKGENHKFSCLSVPIIRDEPVELIRFTVFSKDGTYFITDTRRLTTALLTFVKGRKIYYKLLVINKEDKPINLFTSAYFNPFLKNSLVENSTDRWFRQVCYQKNDNLGDYYIETYEERDRNSMATNYGQIHTRVDKPEFVIETKHTTSRYAYVGGSRSSLHTAKTFFEEKLTDEIHMTSFTETGICGDFISYQLEDMIEYSAEMTYTQIGAKSQGEVKKVEQQCFSFEVMGETLIPPETMNGFMYHLKEQVTFCSEIKGYIQLSYFSLIGVRDIFQALEAYLFYAPDLAKKKMLEALNFTSLTGQLPRQYSLPEGENTRPVMDLRPFIDQGVWVISTIVTYLRFTKDWSFLEEECGYYDFIDSDKHIVKKNSNKDSVLIHMIRIMDYLIKNRDHEYTKCVLALYGDWNDALDGLGRSSNPDKEYGSGVSVMATLQVYQNLSEMLEIKERLKEEEDYKPLYERLNKLSNYYSQVKSEIKEGLLTHAIDGDHIIHGWGDQKSYLIGSQNDPDGVARDGLTSQAFWILSGFIKESNQYDRHRDYILKAYERLDSKYGYKTFAPYFQKGLEGVGRIPNLPRGTAENGATYIHASMFAVMSLFAIGQGKLAWEQLLKLLPFTHENVSVSPFVLPNSYGYNEALHIDGESMQDWQTGSSNVLLKLIIRYVIGFEPTLDGIILQPSVYQIFKQMSLCLSYLGCNVTIRYKGQPLKTMNKRRFKINGKPYEGKYDTYMQMDRLFVSDDVIRQCKEAVIIDIIDQ